MVDLVVVEAGALHSHHQSSPFRHHGDTTVYLRPLRSKLCECDSDEPASAGIWKEFHGVRIRAGLRV